MSKKQREREAAKVEQEIVEKKSIEHRRQVRLAPMLKLVKKLTVVILTTFFVLYLGVIINNRLPEILIKISENG